MINLQNFFTASYAFMILYHTDLENQDALNYLRTDKGIKELSGFSGNFAAAVAATRKGADAFDEALVELGRELKTLLPTFERNGKIPASQLGVLRTFGMWMRTGSENAYKRLAALSANNDQRWIPAFFAKEVGSQDDLVKEIRKIVKQITGTPGEHLTKEEGEALRENDPETYKRLAKLKRTFNQTWKDAVSTFVRQSGKKTLPFAQVEKFLNEQGLRHTWSKGFTGNVGADGQWYTKAGKLINGVPQSHMFPQVKMIDDSGESAVFVAIKEDGTKGGYFYTTDYKQAAEENKFQAVQKLMDKIASMRQNWGQKILSFDPTEPICVGSLMLELSFLFASRIGSPGNKNENKGLSTIQMKHVRLLGNGLWRIRYPGKDSVEQTHLLPSVQKATRPRDKAVAKAFEAMLTEDKKGTDMVFTIRKGARLIHVKPSYVNQLFRSYGAPAGTTVHKLRTLRATRVMKEELDELYKKKASFNDPKVFLATLEKLAKKVGEQLGHVRRNKDGTSETTGTTSLQNYIDPTLVAQAYEHYRFPIPLWLEKKMKVTSSLEENWDDEMEELAGLDDSDWDPELNWSLAS